MLEKIILEHTKNRNIAFLDLFCDKGTYLDAHGQNVVGVCRTVTATEMLNFMSNQDHLLLEALKAESV